MDRRVDALRGGIGCRSRGGGLGVDNGEMAGGGSVERSFKNKGAAKVQPLPLAPILLVQKFVCAGEAGVEEAAVTVGTCKGSLNRRWGCSGKTLRRSSQFSASTRMECSNGEFSRVLR